MINKRKGKIMRKMFLTKEESDDLDIMLQDMKENPDITLIDHWCRICGKSFIEIAMRGDLN